MDKMSDKKNQLIGIIEKPEKFYSTLIEIRDVNELIQICSDLKKDIEIDYFDLAYKTVESNYSVFSLSRILEKIAYISILELENITRLYEFFYRGMLGDMACGTQYEITKNLVLHHADFAPLLLHKLQDINEEYTIFHASMILTTLHNEHKMNQYKQIKEYLDDTSNINKTLSSIEAISKIDLSPKEVNEVFESFNKINDLNQEKLSTALIYSCNKLKDVYFEFKEILLKLSKTDNKIVKFHISRILSFNNQDAVSDVWYRECLFALTDTTSEELGIVDNFSYVFVNILEGTNDYRVIRDFFIEWVSKSDIVSNFPEKKLEYFIHEFAAKYPEEHNKFITEIFYSENDDFHVIVSKLITSETVFDKNMIAEYTFQDLLYMCRKVLGYMYEFESMKNLVWSLSIKVNLTLSEQSLIFDVFTNHIGVDYPHDTVDFFKELDSKKLNKEQQSIAKQIAKSLEDVITTYKQLPRLKELIPPSLETRDVFKANQLSMGKVMKKAQQESILRQLATTIHIKYGKGSFHHMNGEYTEPSYMQRISTSVSYPVTERTHPIAAAIQRYNFRTAKKGDS